MVTVREVADGVWAVHAGSFPSNNYVCATHTEGEAIVVDVGLDPDAVDDALRQLALRPRAVYCTHGHFDHIGGASVLQDRYDIPVHLHHADIETARRNNFLLLAMKRKDRIVLPRITEVDDGFSIAADGGDLTYIAVPGHTPGSCAIGWGSNLFTGDTLYSYGIGLSKLPGEKPELLRQSIGRLWPILADYTVHPGHGESALGGTIMQDNAPLLRFLAVAQEQSDG